MEQLTKNFKLIGGVLIIICCLLPFFMHMNGFYLFKTKDFLAILTILLILAGAAGLIFVDVMKYVDPTKKEIMLAPKFSLSLLAKLLVLAGVALILIKILSEILGIGFFLLVIVLLVLLYEEKIVAAIKK